MYELVLFYLLWIVLSNNEDRRPMRAVAMDAENVSSDATER